MKLIVFLIFTANILTSQTVVNGDFSTGASSWGCSPETNPVSVYGGSGSNTVAEVDAAASLCQTITGFGVGSVYNLSFVCSRRTGGCPSPATTNINVTISGGALSTTVSRTNTAFNLTTSSFNFTATSTSQVLNIAAGSGFGSSTCGMIIDDIQITLYSGLPIELTYFNLNLNGNKTVDLAWETASELNNDYFTIERSLNAINWEELIKIKGAGNSTEKRYYSFTDFSPHSDISYYRLKQTDFNKTYKYSQIQSISLDKDNTISIFPNPSNNHKLTINSKTPQFKVNIINNIGEIIKSFSSQNSTYELDLTMFPSGLYFFTVIEKDDVMLRERIILE